MRRLLAALWLLSTGVIPSEVNAAWQSERVEIVSGHNEKRATAVFTYDNISGRAINLYTRDKSCGCIDVELPHGSILPGKRAKIAARISLDGRNGAFEEYVILDESPVGQSTRLVIAVKINDLIIVQPSLLRWQICGTAEPKSAVVTIADPANTRVIEALSQSPEFMTRVVECPEKRTLAVEAIPRSVAAQRSVRSFIMIHATRKTIYTISIQLVLTTIIFSRRHLLHRAV